MNTSDLLEQLLRSSQGATAQRNAGAARQDGLGGLLGGLLGAGSQDSRGGGLGGLLGGLLGGGGSAGGVASRPQTPVGGSRYAMLASLGMMAFQAYQAWQRQQASAPQQAMRTVDQLAGPEVESHSHAILRALIAAAKADGRIDEQEQSMIRSEIAQHSDDPDLQQWLDDEVTKPLDASDVAQAAKGDSAMAAEMYLASAMVVNDQQDVERKYLDELASALNLDPQLQIQLERQAKGGTA